MADWDYVECGFNAADETINFGTRNIAGLDCLYETSTLASIKCTKEGSIHKPNVKSVVKNGSIYFSIDKTMKVFSDLNCSDLSFNVTFDDLIEVFCITSDGKYLILCLRNGPIHCFDMENGTLIYTDNLFENATECTPLYLDAFIENESVTLSVILILKSGRVYRITIAPGTDESQNSSVQFTHDLVTDIKSEIHAAAFLYPLLMMSAQEGYICNTQTRETDYNDISQLKRVFPYNRIYLGLDWDGHLISICSKTMLSYLVTINTLFDDILLMTEHSNSFILGITKKNEDNISYLQLLNYPEYDVVFSLKMTSEIYLVTPENTNDEMMIISEVKHGGTISELRFQVIYETSPENRLKRLLRKQKFDEAEQCAKLFQLNVVEIKKAKAQVILDKVVCSETDIDNLLDILKTIEDYDFQIKSCLDGHNCCSNLKDVERILKYGCLLSEESGQIISEKTQDILELMFRFNTFVTLVRCGGKNNSVQGWIDFSNCDLIQELHMTLEQNHIEDSIIIYSRFDAITISNLNESDVSSILEVLNNVSMEKQLPFLTTFLPLTLSHITTSVDMFIQWIADTVFQSEIKYQSEFPEIAIKFMKKTIPLLKVESCANINFQQQCVINPKSLLQLTNLLDALEQLQYLKNNYNIAVPLQQFLQPKEILIETFLINRGIDIVDNEIDLKEFIQKFIQNYHLEPDVIFANVVKNIVKYAEEFWIKVVPVILNAIGCVNLKLEATLITLKAANVPWCPAIHEVATRCLQYSHPLVKEIIHEIEYEPKCVIFNKHPYNLDKRYIQSMEDLERAMNRIIYCNQPSMIADLYQVCKDSTEMHEAKLLLIKHYLKIGEPTNALQVLNDNSQEELIKCCKHLDVFAGIVMNNKYKFNNLQENCYKILGPIFKKLQDNAEDFEKSYYRERLQILTSIYKVHKNFNTKISYEDLINGQKKNLILKNLLLCIMEEFQVNKDIPTCIQNCDKVATYLGIDKDLILLKLCEEMGDFNVIIQAAENIYFNEASAITLCRIVALLLKWLGSSNIPFKKNCEIFSEGSFLQNIANTDLDIFIKGLKLAEKIIVKATLISTPSEIGNCIELSNLVQATSYMTQDDMKHSPFFLKNSFRGDPILPSLSSLDALKNVFLLYFEKIGPISQPSMHMHYFNAMMQKPNKIQLSSEIQPLHSTVNSLCTDGHALVAYKLLKTVQNGLIATENLNADINEQINNIMQTCIRQLLQNVFTARQIDTDFAYSLLLSCPPKYSCNFLFQSLKFYKRVPSKFKTIAQIFLCFQQHYNIKDHQNLCINIIYLFKWWNRIKNCQIPYDHFFKKSPTDLVKNLIKLNHLNIDSIKEFCLDFKLDQDIYYEVYLKNLLLHWKANYITKADVLGKEILIVKSDENQLIQDCMEVIDVIENKKSVYDMLNHTWDSINFYHYEVFICVLSIISMLNPHTDNNQKTLMLSFLKNYNRTSKPGKTEEEEWFTLSPDTHCIDVLSKWRLPFTPTLFTNQIWNIIRPEINLKTYTKWFDTISILKKNLKDDICSYVIKDIVASGVFQQEPSSEWVLHARHTDLLKEIDVCLQHMSNLEQATSAIYCVATNITGGADQVNAITLCYGYAQEYYKQSPRAKDVHKALVKVRNKYFSFSTAHILHTNKLADKKYLDMISGPVEALIEALYMDERIIKKAAFVASYCPDINKAVKELAALYNIDVEEKRKQLVNTWLSTDTTTAIFSPDTSILLPDVNTQEKYKMFQCNDLIRASYICTSNDKTIWRTHLLQLGDVKPTESRNLNFKANALKCFCNISDVETIEELTETGYEAFRNFINKLTLISYLECFGFSLNIETLDQYNKKDLLSRLAYNITNPVGVKSMALVCTTYTIYEAKFWAAVLNAMVKLNMVQELKDCVIFLKGCVSFHSNKFYIEAWQAVIGNSFDFTSNINEEEMTSLCMDNFYLMQSCPVLFALDFEYIVKKCLHLKKYDFAALAVQYVTSKNQTIFLKEILSADRDVFKKLDELAQHGFWGTPFIKRLIRELEQEEL